MRHLYEAEIEAYIASHPQHVLRWIYSDPEVRSDALFERPRSKSIWVERQKRLPSHGIADVWIVHSVGTTIVECKRDIIEDSAIPQALRYRGACCDWWRAKFTHPIPAWYTFTAVLVAPRISRQAAAAIAGCDRWLRFIPINTWHVERNAA